MVGGQLAVLERVMRRFAQTYAQGLPALASVAESARWPELLHSLRGAAASIGAQALADAAAALEHALAAGGPPERLAAQAREVHESLQTLVARMAAALQPS